MRLAIPRAAGLSLALAACAAAPSGSGPDTDVPVDSGATSAVEAIVALEGDPARGATLYDSVAECADCHGVDGDGTLLDAGVDLRQVVPDRTDEELVRAVVEGVPDTAMVAFLGFLSRQEIADVVAHLRSLP